MLGTKDFFTMYRLPLSSKDGFIVVLVVVVVEELVVEVVDVDVVDVVGVTILINAAELSISVCTSLLYPASFVTLAESVYLSTAVVIILLTSAAEVLAL